VTFPGADVIHFRNYASAGALYPVEVYLACADLPGLTAGVYHFDPRGPALTCLREGDHRAHLVRAAASEPAVARAPLVLVLTGLPWRTAWKYTERGYRHLFWDAGMIVTNLLALATLGRLSDAGGPRFRRRRCGLAPCPRVAARVSARPRPRRRGRRRGRTGGRPSGRGLLRVRAALTDRVRVSGHLPGERDGSTRVSGGRPPVAGGMDRRLAHGVEPCAARRGEGLPRRGHRPSRLRPSVRRRVAPRGDPR
jgi:hypothetical protein